MAAEPNRNPEDLGMLAARLLFAIEEELFDRLHKEGFDDIVPRHGIVLAYLPREGSRATEIARISGVAKQVVGLIVDDLERLGYVERQPDPADRRAKLVLHTERGLAEMKAGGAIMADIMDRHQHVLGQEEFHQFLSHFRTIIAHQRSGTHDDRST